jgi:predicted metal-dependent hydrolase
MQTDNILWLWKKSAKRKHIALHIDDSGLLEVRTPLRTSQRKVEQLIIEKRAWIEHSTQIQQERIHPKLPQYAPEGELYLHGELYRFEVQTAKKSSLTLEGKNALIETPSKEAFDKLLKAWYKERTKVVVETLLRDFEPMLAKPYQDVGYRYYKRRLGSCDSKNNLMFNSLLAVHKEEHIRYVVAHELAHIKEKNHSPRFYAEGERILPGFRGLDKEMRT